MEAKKTGNKKWIVIAAAVAAVVCIVAAVVILSAGSDTEKRLAEQLDLAERYLSELDYESAIAAYETAIEIAPKSEDAYKGLADAYIGLGDYEAAIEALESGIEETDSEMLTEYLAEVNAEYSQIEAARLAEEAETAESAGEAAVGAAEEEAAGSADESAVGEEASTEEETVGEEELSAEEAAAAGSVPYTVEIAAIATASIGDIVYFGSYEQDNDTTNGTEPVAWYVLDNADGEATLLSVYLLDKQPYNKEYADITWENCTLRRWLNGEFYNMAFSKEEQAAIVTTNVVNEDNPLYSGRGGNDTVDKVWLLSIGEIERYFNIDMNARWDDYIYGNMDWNEYAIYCYEQDNRVCAKPTAYAKARRVLAYSEEQAQSEMENYGYDMSYAVGSGEWWLRSPGIDGESAVFVYNFGCVGFNGQEVEMGDGVRPVLKVVY